MPDFIHIPAGPTDAELEAERDAKHAAEVKWWLGNHKDLGDEMSYCADCTHHVDNHHTGEGCVENVDTFFGELRCTCLLFVRDCDE